MTVEAQSSRFAAQGISKAFEAYIAFHTSGSTCGPVSIMMMSKSLAILSISFSLSKRTISSD
ncbi:Uncharacterised protein [Vibrio cholerae]|nr:Uncharacterised protein [Vibrio cholerae]